MLIKNMSGETYASFVNYAKLDPVKRAAMEIFVDTLRNPERMRIRPTRVGESGIAFDFLDYDFAIGFNVEGLGTKNLIADVMYEALKQQGYSTLKMCMKLLANAQQQCLSMTFQAAAQTHLVMEIFLQQAMMNGFQMKKETKLF